MAKSVIEVQILGNSKSLQGALDDADKGFGGFASSVGKAALGIGVALGTAAAGIGILAGKASIDLETAFAPVGTLLGANTTQFADMETAMKSFVSNSPLSPKDIGMGAYTALSAGITGVSGVTEALTASQKLAQAGLGNMEGAMGLVTSAMNSFKGEGLTADEAAKAFFGTIASGKTTTDGLAQGFGGIAPLAAAAGVKFTDLLAATAAITSTGAEASTAYAGLKGALSAVIKPSADAAKTAKDLGLEFSQAHLASVGLPKFLDEIKVATGGNVETMAKLFGGVEGLNTVLALTGPQADAFTANLTNIGTAGEGMSDRAAEMSDTVANRFAIMKNKATLALGALGDKIIGFLLPKVEFLQAWITEHWPEISAIFSKVMKAIGNFWTEHGQPVFDALIHGVQWVAEWVVDHWPQIKTVVIAVFKAIINFGKNVIDDVLIPLGKALKTAFLWLMDNKEFLIGIAIALGAVLVAMFISWAVGAAAAAVATIAATLPLIALVAAVAAVAGGIIYAYNHFEVFRNVVDAIGRFFRDDFIPILKAVWEFISDNIIPIIKVLVEIWLLPLKLAFKAIVSIITDFLIPTFSAMYDFITTKVIPIFEAIISTALAIATTVGNVVGEVVGFITGIPEKIGSAAATMWNAITTSITTAKDWVGSRVTEIVNFVIGIPGRFVSFVGSTFHGIETAASGAKDWVSDRIDDIVNFATGLPGRMVGLFGGMWDGIKDAFKSALNVVIGWWNGIEFKMPSQHIWGVGDIGGWTIGLPDIKPFHTGGIVPGRPGEEVLILAKAGEEVLTEEQQGSGSPGLWIDKLYTGNSTAETVEALRRMAWLEAAA